MSSPEARRDPGGSARCRRRSRLDVAAVHARLPLRARADGHRLRARPGRRGARRAARVLVQAARQGAASEQSGLLRFAVVALAVSVAATWLLSTVSTRIQRRFRDKVTIALESHVARLQAGIATIVHQERPEYLDRLSVLREETYTLDHMYMSVFSTVGWLLRLAITVVLLATVNPVLVMLVLFALPTVAATSWRPVVERTAQERGAQADPLARTCTRCPPRPLLARNCGCSASAKRSPTGAGPRGRPGTGRWPPPDRGPPPGTRAAGRSSRSARAVRHRRLSPPGRARRLLGRSSC